MVIFEVGEVEEEIFIHLWLGSPGIYLPKKISILENSPDSCSIHIEGKIQNLDFLWRGVAHAHKSNLLQADNRR